MRHGAPRGLTRWSRSPSRSPPARRVRPAARGLSRVSRRRRRTLIADLFAEFYRERRAPGPGDPRLRPGPAPRADRPAPNSPRATTIATAVRIAAQPVPRARRPRRSRAGLRIRPRPRSRPRPDDDDVRGERGTPLAESIHRPDWEQRALAGGFDRFHSRLVDWARKAPPARRSPRSQGLISASSTRPRAEIDLDRPSWSASWGLGTGKSTFSTPCSAGRSAGRARSIGR